MVYLFKMLELLIITLGWSGLLILLYINQTSVRKEAGLGVLGALAVYFSYFTVLSNYLVALSLTIPLFAPNASLTRFLSEPKTLSGIMVYILLVGLIYHFVLAKLWDPQGLRKVGTIISHYLIPSLYVLYWISQVPKGLLNFTDPLLWLVFPNLYFLYILVRGAIVNKYPYPIVDVSEKGFPRVLINGLLINSLLLMSGLIIVWLDRQLG